MTNGTTVRVRRVYEPGSEQDGVRVLVDRLWPRGLAKADAELDEWLKDVAPSAELRRWYGHDPDRFTEFVRRYQAELGRGAAREGLVRLRELAARGPLTLVTATRDLGHSNAAVLASVLAGSAADPSAGEDEEEGGDPACWLRRVCPECGRMADADPPTRCPECGADIPGA